jgi:hypothetical protein
VTRRQASLGIFLVGLAGTLGSLVVFHALLGPHWRAALIVAVAAGVYAVVAVERMVVGRG